MRQFLQHFCTSDTSDLSEKYDLFTHEVIKCSSDQQIGLKQYEKSHGQYYKLPDYKINPYSMLRFYLAKDDYDTHTDLSIANVPSWIIVRHCARTHQYQRHIICYDNRIQMNDYITEPNVVYEFVCDQQYSLGCIHPDGQKIIHSYSSPNDVYRFFSTLTNTRDEAIEFAQVEKDMNPFTPDPSEIWHVLQKSKQQSTLDKVSEYWTEVYLQQYKDHCQSNTIQHNLLYKSASTDPNFSLQNPIMHMWVHVYESCDHSAEFPYVTEQSYHQTFINDKTQVQWVSGQTDDNDEAPKEEETAPEVEPRETQKTTTYTQISAHSKYMNVDHYKARRSTGTLSNPALTSEIDSVSAKQYKHLMIESAACRAGNDVLINNNMLMKYDSIHVKNASITNKLPFLDCIYFSSCIVSMENIALVENLYMTDSVLHGSFSRHLRSICLAQVSLTDLRIDTLDSDECTLIYVHISNCEITNTQIVNLLTWMKSGHFTITNCSILGTLQKISSNSIEISLQNNAEE